MIEFEEGTATSVTLKGKETLLACYKEDRTKIFPFIQLTLCVFSSVSNSNGLFSLLT